MARPRHQVKNVNAKADFFEASLRASFARAMRGLQKGTSINALAMSMSNHRQARDQVPRKAVEAALEPLRPLLVKAFLRGGKLGEQHIRQLGR